MNIVLLSGGMDSAVVLAIARTTGPVTAITFDYGQQVDPHGTGELVAAVADVQGEEGGIMKRDEQLTTAKAYYDSNAWRAEPVERRIRFLASLFLLDDDGEALGIDSTQDLLRFTNKLCKEIVSQPDVEQASPMALFEMGGDSIVGFRASGEVTCTLFRTLPDGRTARLDFPARPITGESFRRGMRSHFRLRNAIHAARYWKRRCIGALGVYVATKGRE